MAIRWNNEAMNDLSRSKAVSQPVMKAAARIAQTIRNDAPVDSGEFKDSIGTHLKFQERAVGVVESTDKKALIIEARKGVMARAVKKSARSGR